MLKVDLRNIPMLVRKIEQFRQSLPELAAREVVQQVRELAAKGKDPDGSSWKPYTKRYAARRKAKGLRTSPVDKKVSGEFLASVKNRDGIIAPSPEQMAKAEGLEKKRVSFEVAPETVGKVERLYRKVWDAIT